MLIKQITLQNFRQFKGKQELVFATDSNQNVTVLLGDYTFGKTTILQAFNWCLFNEADFPKESNPDFLLNLDLAEEKAGMEQKLEVYVELILEHNDIEYTILRKRPYVDRGYGNWVPLQTQLTVVYKEGGLTKPVREGEEQQIINSILPKSLSGYFFFDTERVSDISTRKDLTDAVQGLLGLAPVANARKHLGSRTAKSSAIGCWNAALDLGGDERAKEAQATIESESSNIESMKQQIDNADHELESLNAQKAKIEEMLRENQSTAELQRSKQDLEEKLKTAQSDRRTGRAGCGQRQPGTAGGRGPRGGGFDGGAEHGRGGAKRLHREVRRAAGGGGCAQDCEGKQRLRRAVSGLCRGGPGLAAGQEHLRDGYGNPPAG